MTTKCNFFDFLVDNGPNCRGVWLAKMTSVQFSVQFCKKLWILVRFYKINCSFVFSVWLLHTEDFKLHLSVDAIFHLRLYGVTQEMTYYHAELVQLIVSRSNSELEVQRYGMKKNTFTVDPIMLEDELSIRQSENHPQTAAVSF